MTIISELVVGSSEPLAYPCWDSIWLDLMQVFYTQSQLRELMFAMSLSHPENNVLLQMSSNSIFYNLSAPSPLMIPELWREGHSVVVTFTVEHLMSLVL